MSRTFIFSVVFFGVWAAAPGMVQAAKAKPAATNDQEPVRIEMANVLFRYSPDLTVQVDGLRGTLMPADGHSVPSFNDPSSFAIGTDAAEIRMSTAQLSALMNSWLLRSPKAQLKRVKITAEGDHLRIRGTMKRGVSVPFDATGEPGLSGDNRIRITIRNIKAADLPVKGLLDALGITMGDLVSQKGLHGMSVDKDSFLIDPQTAFPPPQIRAKLTKVQLRGQSLVITMGQGMPADPKAPAKNFIAVKGGSIRYGREQMNHADLTMIDTTPADPFDFDLGHYWCQIVAGTIKAMPNGALVLRVPDYAKLPAGACK